MIFLKFDWNFIDFFMVNKKAKKILKNIPSIVFRILSKSRYEYIENLKTML